MYVKLWAVERSTNSILNSFGHRSQYISIKFQPHKQFKNPWICYKPRQSTARDFMVCISNSNQTWKIQITLRSWRRTSSYFCHCSFCFLFFVGGWNLLLYYHYSRGGHLVSCGTGWSAKVLHRRSDIVAAVATPRPLTLSKKHFRTYNNKHILDTNSFWVDSFYENRI